MNMNGQFFIDVSQKLKPVSIERIIRPHNIKEEKLRETIFPDKIEEMILVVPPIEEFFDKFPLPKDCQKLVILHMLSIITGLREKSNFNDEEFFELFFNYSSKMFSMFPNFLSETTKINFSKEWKNFKEKYKHDQVTLETLEQVYYFIIYLQNSESTAPKETSKINQNLRREIIMQKTEFSKDLNDLLDTLFQVGINKSIDITIYLLINCKLGYAEGVVANDDIMDKLGITEKEYLDSIKRLEKHGVLSAKMPTNEERENAATV